MEQEDKKKLFILFCHRKYSTLCLSRGGTKKKSVRGKNTGLDPSCLANIVSALIAIKALKIIATS